MVNAEIFSSELVMLNREPHLRLLGRNEDKTKMDLLVKGHKPFFYVLKSEEDKIDFFCEKVNGFKSIYGDDLIKIIVDNPWDIRELKLKFSKSFEADIKYPIQFLVEKNINTCIEINNGKLKASDKEIMPRVMMLDIETRYEGGSNNQMEAPIISISFHDNFTDRFYTIAYNKDGTISQRTFKFYSEVMKKEYECDEFIVKNEKEVLEKFKTYVLEMDPDIWSGWNHVFDLTYIMHRLEFLNLNPESLSPLGKYYGSNGYVNLGSKQSSNGKVSAWKPRKDYKNKNIVIRGRGMIDLLPSYKKVKWKSIDSFKLDEVGKSEFGIGKITYTGWMKDFWESEFVKFLAYNRKDIEICLAIDKKYSLIDIQLGFRRITGCQLDDIYFNSRMLDTYILRQCKGKLVLPTKVYKEMSEKEDVEGGFVAEPAVGIFKNVACLDMSSFYPNIMKGFNMGSDTINMESGDYIVGNGVKFNSSPVSLSVNMLNTLLNKREEIRIMLKDPNINKDPVKYLNLYKKQYCFAEDTQILTTIGIKNIKDIKIGDLVYSINLNSFNLEIKPVTNLYKYENKTKIYEFCENRLPCLHITGNHHLLLRNSYNNKIEILPADEVIKNCKSGIRYKFLRSNNIIKKDNKNIIDLAKYIDEKDFFITSKFIQRKTIGDCPYKKEKRFISKKSFLGLIAWFITEGNFYKYNKNSGTTKIVQTNTQNRNLIRNIIKGWGLHSWEYKNDRFCFVSSIFQYIIDTYIKHGSYFKEIPNFIFSDFGYNDYKYFWEQMMLGDGSASKRIYTTKSLKLAEDFTRLSLLVGLNPSLYLRNRKTKTISYKVHFTMLKDYYFSIGEESCREIAYKKKYVYNLTVKDNHTVYAGINGKFAWVGQSYKTFQNSWYGVHLFPSFRLFDSRIGASITAVGRFLTHKIIEYVKSKGYTPVRADSDSCFVYFGDVTTEKSIQLGKELEKEINGKYVEWFKDNHCNTSFFNIKFEKLMGLMLSGKEKKIYSGKIIYDWEKGILKTPEIESKGFAVKRGDRSHFSRNMQKHVFEMIFEEKSRDEILEYIRQEIINFRNKKYDWETIGIPKAITQDIEDYKTDNPYVRGTKWSAKNIVGFTSSPKPYLLYLNKTQKYDTDVICFENNNQVPDDISIDWARMSEVNIFNILKNVCSMVGITEDDLRYYINNIIIGQKTLI